MAQQKQSQLADKMDLSSYLLKPVQRISKYSLLLQDMVRECGPQRGREMAEVQAALEVIQFQLRHGNNLLAMDDIQDCDVRIKMVLTETLRIELMKRSLSLGAMDGLGRGDGVGHLCDVCWLFMRYCDKCIWMINRVWDEGRQ